MGERKSALEMTAEEIEDEAIRLGDELPTSDTESDVRIDILRSDRDYFLGVIRELKALPLVSVVIPAGECIGYFARCSYLEPCHSGGMFCGYGGPCVQPRCQDKDNNTCPMGAGAFVVEMREKG